MISVVPVTATSPLFRVSDIVPSDAAIGADPSSVRSSGCMLVVKLRGACASHYPKPAPPPRPPIVFESLRKSLDDLLSRSTPPEERRQIVSRMRDTLVQAKMGLQDLRDGLAQSKRRLDQERRELDTVLRRKRLAEQINDAETVRLATQYEQMHAERVAVLERKLEAQESELALAERDVTQMMTELRQAASGIPSAGERSNASVSAAMDEIESEMGS